MKLSTFGSFGCSAISYRRSESQAKSPATKRNDHHISLEPPRIHQWSRNQAADDRENIGIGSHSFFSPNSLVSHCMLLKPIYIRTFTHHSREYQRSTGKRMDSIQQHYWYNNSIRRRPHTCVSVAVRTLGSNMTDYVYIAGNGRPIS